MYLYPIQAAYCLFSQHAMLIVSIRNAFSCKYYLSINDLSYRDGHYFLIKKFKGRRSQSWSSSSVIFLRVSSCLFFHRSSVFIFHPHMSCFMATRCLLQLQASHNVHMQSKKKEKGMVLANSLLKFVPLSGKQKTSQKTTPNFVIHFLWSKIYYTATLRVPGRMGTWIYGFSSLQSCTVQCGSHQLPVTIEYLK